MKDNYYDIEKISPTTYKIYEDFQASMYLVCGTQRAVLIDTGYGGSDVWKEIRALTSLPVSVINTHGHIDHVMGNRLFESARLNSADKFIYDDFLSEFPEIMRYEMTQGQYAEELKDFDIDSVKFPEPEDIKEGDVIELGGVKLEVLEAPGHTPGSIVLVNREEKILFSGDAVIEHLWMFLDHSCSNEVCLASLRKVRNAAFTAGIEKIYNGHYAYHPMPVSILDTMVDGMEQIVAGKAQGKPFEMEQGKGVEYSFDGWSVLCKE